MDVYEWQPISRLEHNNLIMKKAYCTKMRNTWCMQNSKSFSIDGHPPQTAHIITSSWFNGGSKLTTTVYQSTPWPLQRINHSFHCAARSPFQTICHNVIPHKTLPCWGSNCCGRMKGLPQKIAAKTKAYKCWVKQLYSHMTTSVQV